MQIAGIGKISRQRLAKVLRGSDGSCITPIKVSHFLEVSQEQAHTFLSGWAENGWLRRIRRGIYLPIDIKAEFTDQIFIDPWIVATELFSPCYIGGWSAIEHWGFTEQIFESTIVFTAKHINKKKENIEGIWFLVKKLSQKKMFGLKTVWRDQVKIFVSDPHKTIVDLLDDPCLGGGIRSVVDFFEKYLYSEYFDEKLLLEYAHRMKNRTIFKRLGFLLTLIKPDEFALIEKCKQNISKGYSQLDPSLKGDHIVKRWELWVPEGLGFKDR